MRILSGRFKNKPLSTPKGMQTRPTTSQLRQIIFDICQFRIEESSVLDLFAGSGAVGIEALSRGAKSATFADKNQQAIQCIKKNIQSLNLENNVEVWSRDVFFTLKSLQRSSRSFDFIYIDPPYDQVLDQNQTYGIAAKVLLFIDKHTLLNESGTLFLEAPSDHPFTLPPLSHLSLNSDRKVGRARLLEFRRVI